MIEIGDRCLRILQIIQNITTVHVGFGHLRIALQRATVIIDRLVEQALLLVHVSLKQREVWFLRQYDLVARSQREGVVITT